MLFPLSAGCWIDGGMTRSVRKLLAADLVLACRRELPYREPLAVLLEAAENCEAETPTVLADGGVENFNRGVGELIESELLRCVLAMTELRFSNSMIEAWWGTLKHQWF